MHTHTAHKYISLELIFDVLCRGTQIIVLLPSWLKHKFENMLES